MFNLLETTLKKSIIAIMLLSTSCLTAGAFMEEALSAPAATALGDLAPYRVIVADTLAIAKSGDMTKAEKRITDFETAWDKAEPAMRPMGVGEWTAVDQAADAALDALRSGSPTPQTVVPPLDALIASLDNPAGAGDASAASAPGGAFSIVDADGSPVPCEVALDELRRVSATKAPAAADKGKFDELQSKGLERCNADDDRRADGFFADALALLGP